ncbi:galactokinase [Serendipita sp. 399]|nr:galactokinase [Serendipita sp. 399]
MTSLTQLPVTVHTTVSDLTENIGDALAIAHNWNQLAEQFQERYGKPPTHVVRAPGRVNIIGEHIDYALFGVLPAAIENELTIAVRATPDSDGVIVVDNTDPKYTKTSFSALKRENDEWDLAIDPEALRWESYVKAAYLGVLDRFFKQSSERPVGMEALFSSTIPAGSGVSSSAALIVASTLAFLVVNDKLSAITKGDLIGMSVGNEKRVGVNSGGMDQSASILSAPGHALYISFYPTLQSHPTPLPTSSRNPTAFVIANSLTVSNKAETGKSRYNLRVVETLVGAKVLSRILGVPTGLDERATYREVLARWWKKEGKEDSEDSLKEEIAALLRGGYLEKLKGKDNDGVLLEQMITMTGMNEDDFHRVFLSWVEEIWIIFQVEATHFQLYKRARHVFTEALRVLQFRDLCLEKSEDLPEKLGQLMNDSQESCSKLFECSCPELDNLTSLANSLGAYGSRLTGAGWGGCTVSLVKEEEVETFTRQLREQYGPFKKLSDEEFATACFATKPAEGACDLTTRFSVQTLSTRELYGERRMKAFDVRLFTERVQNQQRQNLIGSRVYKYKETF